MTDDYIELKPNDVIREGDEIWDVNGWSPVPELVIGTKATWFSRKFRRPVALNVSVEQLRKGGEA